MPDKGEVLHAQSAVARAGGGGGVVASVLAGLGAEVDFFCALGRDPHGEAACAQLTKQGIAMHVAWRDEPTRRALTLLESAGERTIVTIGERLEPRGSDQLEWGRLSEADGVYFTAGDSGALRFARGARVLVASPRGRRALEQGPQIDALVFSASDRSESEWAERLRSCTRLLVITEGARGGHWEGEVSGRWVAVAPPGEVHDSYGCGDSFAAGFTFALADGRSVADAAAVGAECGARALTTVGAP